MKIIIYLDYIIIYWLTIKLYNIYFDFFIDLLKFILSRHIDITIPTEILEPILNIYNQIMFYYTKNLLYIYPDSEFAKLNITLKKTEKKHKII